MHKQHNFDNCNSEIITWHKFHNGRINYKKTFVQDSIMFKERNRK